MYLGGFILWARLTTSPDFGSAKLHPAILLNWYGVPKGIRTPVIAVKGRCPRPG